MKSGLWEATNNISKGKNSCFVKVVNDRGVYVDMYQNADYPLHHETIWMVKNRLDFFKNYSYIAPLDLLNWDS